MVQPIFPAWGLSNTFGFKIQDKQGKMHKFNCGMHTHFGVTQLELYHRSFFSHVMPSNLYYCSSSIDKSNLPQILVLFKLHSLYMCLYTYITVSSLRFLLFLIPFDSTKMMITILSSDTDLIPAVEHAKQIGRKVIGGKFNLYLFSYNIT